MRTPEEEDKICKHYRKYHGRFPYPYCEPGGNGKFSLNKMADSSEVWAGRRFTKDLISRILIDRGLRQKDESKIHNTGNRIYQYEETFWDYWLRKPWV